MRFELGQRVRITGVAQKDYPSEGHTTHVEGPLPVYGGEVLTEGIIVGKRSLSDYSTDTWVEEGWLGFNKTTHKSTKPVKNSGKDAWLVALDIRYKPVVVLDSQVEPIEGETNVK